MISGYAYEVASRVLLFILISWVNDPRIFITTLCMLNILAIRLRIKSGNFDLWLSIRHVIIKRLLKNRIWVEFNFSELALANSKIQIRNEYFLPVGPTNLKINGDFSAVLSMGLNFNKFWIRNSMIDFRYKVWKL